MSDLADFLRPVRLKRQQFTATASQTVFTLTSVTIVGSDPERVSLLINGLEQPPTAYTIDSPTQITISEPLEGGETVVVTTPGF